MIRVNKKVKQAVLSFFAVYVTFWIGHRLVTRALDGIGGLEFEPKSSYNLGFKKLIVADQGSGATSGFATSFHIDWNGISPCSANRVLVLPVIFEDLKVVRVGNELTVFIPEENKLQLARDFSCDGISIHLNFAGEN